MEKNRAHPDRIDVRPFNLHEGGSVIRYLFVLLMLSGCATAPKEDPRWAEFDRRMSGAEARLKAGEISKRDLAMTAVQSLQDLQINEPMMDEAWAYRVVLAGKVDRGEMTEDEARYLDTQKVNELTNRYEATQRARQQPRRPLFQPAIRCRPDGYGGTVCR